MKKKQLLKYFILFLFYFETYDTHKVYSWVHTQPRQASGVRGGGCKKHWRRPPEAS
jgi:hypothetical protein